MKIGIVGLPNVGKSTLFNALTNNHVLAANYPFATIEPNVGMVPVPDARLAELAKLYGTAKIIPATVTFVDIAGLVAGAHKGQGLGNQFLAHIRECQAIVQVVRAFDDGSVIHVDDKVNPAADIATINTELVLADIQAIDKRLPKAASDAKGNPKLKLVVQALRKARDILDAGQTLLAADFDTQPIQDLGLLTAKPILYVFNVSEADLQNQAKKRGLSDLVAPAPATILCAKLEAELAGSDPAEAALLLKTVGQDEPGLNALIRHAYDALGLQTFLTAGPKEVRAWTVRRGATAPEAAGVIHTDFQKGFIRAEVVNYQDLMAAGSLSAARTAGRVRSEGKDYVMRPDDVVEFRFNV